MTIPVGNILFLGKRFYTNKDAWEERFGRIYRLPSEWARLGKAVQLWLVDYHTREVLETSEFGMKVISAPILGGATLRAFAQAVRARPAVVVASGDTYIGLMGWLIARATGAQFAFDVYDKYDEFKGYIRPLGFDLFGFLRRRADFRFYPSKALASLYHPGDVDTSDCIVPNGVDDRVFCPLPMQSCRDELELDSASRLVGYFGGMELDRGVVDLLAALRLLREAGEDVRLLLCGKENPATPLKEDWIVYRGMVRHDLMPLYINASDLVVIPYRSSPFMDMGASCKIAEYLMCRRPMVSTRTPNFVANFPEQARELGDGLCEPADPISLARAIRYQLRAKQTLTPPADMAWPEIASKALAALAGQGASVQPTVLAE